jgi:hypothetical protein
MSVWTLGKLLPLQEQILFNELLVQEGKELTKRKIKKLLEQDFELGRIDELHTAMRDKIVENKAVIDDKHAVENNTKYVFITISFDPKVALDRVVNFHNKFIKKGCFSKALGVIEQRGTKEENNIGKGIHAHYLVQRDYRYKISQLKRNVKKSCKRMVGNVESDKFVNFKNCCEEFARDKQDYIILEKYGDDKDKKQEGDRIFRENNNIEKYIGEIIF